MKRIYLLLLICLFFLTSCGGNTTTDMFALPEMPEMQKALIDTVDSVRGGGFDYAEPKSGLNRQSLQLMDLDGDGEDEGIAFLRDVADTYKTYIYVFKKQTGGFKLFDIIEGSKNELYTVSYSDILGKDGYEIIVEWGTSGDENHPITVYNIVNDGTDKILEIFAEQYSVSDIDGNGVNEFLAVVKKQGKIRADVYTSDRTEIKKADEIFLSPNGGKLLRIKSGQVMPGKNGVFIERELGNGVVTDVIAEEDGRFVNMLPYGDVCVTRALCADVTGDGVIEIPKEAADELDSNGANGCYRWNVLSEKERLVPSAFTYHSFTDGWYLLMPLSWSGSVVAKRQTLSPGEIEIHFSTRELIQGDLEQYIEAPLFSVYVLTGGARKKQVSENGRFIISEREDAVIAAEIMSESYLATAIDEEFIKLIFRNRESEWFSEILFA